jgi:hypothetical protein
LEDIIEIPHTILANHYVLVLALAVMTAEDVMVLK